MSRRARDLLLGVALFAVALGGTLWQAEQSGALRAAADGRGDRTGEQEQVSLPRLVCPLH